MKLSNIYHYVFIALLALQASGCSTDDENTNKTPSVLKEFHGSWQNTVVTTNWWVISESSIISYGLFEPEPCGRVDVTVLSETTFSFDQGMGAGEKITMQIIDNQLVLTSPTITATHIRIDNSEIPSSCLTL